jgi:hypothetical protein
MPKVDADFWLNAPEKLGYRYISESVMSNFDHRIAAEVGERLKTGRLFSQYAGWNFCGYVWWDIEAKTFKCEVWQWNEPKEIVSGTLEEIMDQVSGVYGDE